jgi:hypothetical protein
VAAVCGHVTKRRHFNRCVGFGPVERKFGQLCCEIDGSTGLDIAVGESVCALLIA